jgi:hypothetical protein
MSISVKSSLAGVSMLGVGGVFIGVARDMTLMISEQVGDLIRGWHWETAFWSWSWLTCCWEKVSTVGYVGTKDLGVLYAACVVLGCWVECS